MVYLVDNFWTLAALSVSHTLTPGKVVWNSNDVVSTTKLIAFVWYDSHDFIISQTEPNQLKIQQIDQNTLKTNIWFN